MDGALWTLVFTDEVNGGVANENLRGIVTAIIR